VVLPDAAHADDPAGPTASLPRRGSVRGRALLEVVLCSGYPTQLLIIGALGLFGIAPLEPDRQLSPRFVFLVSTIDTVLLVSLMLVLLRGSGERPRDLFFRCGDATSELIVGVGLTPMVFALVVAVLLGVRELAPSLRNVPINPFEALIGSPAELAALILLVLVAGGVREELQRAFLLHRFEQHLGGASVGVLVTSVAFGLGHTLQGWDAAVATGLLGACWGIVYLWRRNVIATVVSHSLFNLSQLLIAFYTLNRAA
jgi:membrane protease YdiL (CAAX protease family)